MGTIRDRCSFISVTHLSDIGYLRKKFNAICETYEPGISIDDHHKFLLELQYTIAPCQMLAGTIATYITAKEGISTDDMKQYCKLISDIVKFLLELHEDISRVYIHVM